jgi:hypothetical protein
LEQRWVGESVGSVGSVVHDRGNATEIVLRHEGLDTPAVRKGHEDGWIGCFNNLQTVVAAA